MKNTLQNKAKFFAKYWGQDIFHWKYPEYATKDNYIQQVGEFIGKYSQCGYLELTPLSQISDEDAIEVAKIYQSNIRGISLLGIGGVSKEEILKAGLEFCKRINGNYWNNYVNVFQMLWAFDFLRSKGYALPYNGITVDEQIEFGWVKLKTE